MSESFCLWETNGRTSGRASETESQCCDLAFHLLRGDGPEFSIQEIRSLQPLMRQTFPSKIQTAYVCQPCSGSDLFLPGRRHQDVPDYHIWEQTRSKPFQIFSDALATFVERAVPALGFLVSAQRWRGRSGFCCQSCHPLCLRKKEVSAFDSLATSGSLILNLSDLSLS